MPKRKPRFTIGRHREIAPELYRIRELLLHLSVEIDNSYPHNSPQVRAGRVALKAVDNLRSVLDDAVCAENPLAVDRLDLISIYYPGGQR